MKLSTILSSTILAAAVALPMAAQASADKPVLGFSIDDLRVERWARDREYFIAAAKELGAEVVVTSADANEQKQVNQVEGLIAQKVDAIAIVPFNSQVFGEVIDEAHKAGIKILSYDRLILNADEDAYISFDNERVGFLQAEAVLKAVPEGNYYLLGGAPTDNNAKLLRAGQEKAIQAAVDAGKVKVIGSQWVKEWSPTEALSIMENALTAANNKIDAVIASNDGTAGGAIQALAAQGLAGKVAISGQDADLAAIKRVIDGTQTVTVYKPLQLIASEAAKLSVKLVKGETVEFNAKLDNGQKEVDSLLLTPIPLTKDNVMKVVEDGFYTKEQVEAK
ncbi:D-xylose transporter subunit; periplasmic-binding component of ABC superfamily [uncultured Pleomorphomonas sp.]|uniref:D-xylose-binding periplasmic protein n=2 Tax=Pleomorphomonas TaxID=261933 RepID=A0A2G9WPT2_9HYPH|nr:D-xylose ABC transporter substrate-binding protein [Pleomorphomonas carboxyditropha]PIO96683.1 D-xylose ABC transporter substrate-binding protein [Pleomorphomonas carboxyditropha]SCM74490.1 D-xylose transporter subunit; periplasmic-binding component of ABC superfamily [uncultured Pleomorphomonas sp.]SCM76808.1 D-xylose transporter subunit; periplasmic-binding component of ABC superfamily [uncultured Pleomorphomonas sp.]